MSDSRPVLAIRPEPGLRATVALGREMGLNMHGFALCEVQPLAWELPPQIHYDALLIGSANAVRHGGENLASLMHLPVHSVGEATAREAEAAGFTVTLAGSGGLQKVIEQARAPIRYLRLVGSEYVELSLPPGVSFEPVQVYKTHFREFRGSSAKLLGQDPIVLLHSAAMTRQFVSECRRLGVDRSSVTLAAMGQRIIEPSGDGWRAIHVSDAPNDTALLEMVRAVCI